MSVRSPAIPAVPLYSGTKAIGLTSGGSGSGNCSSGGATYFQPVTEALSAYGVSAYGVSVY